MRPMSTTRSTLTPNNAITLSNCTGQRTLRVPATTPAQDTLRCRLPRSASGGERADLLQRAAEPVLLHLQVIAGLQVDPEPLGGTEEPGQPQRRVGADPPLAVHDLVDPPGRNPDLLRHLVLAHPQRLEELFQQDLTRVHRGHDRVRRHVLPFPVVVGDLDVLRPDVGPPEADPPLLVNPDAVLAGTSSARAVVRGPMTRQVIYAGPIATPAGPKFRPVMRVCGLEPSRLAANIAESV